MQDNAILLHAAIDLSYRIRRHQIVHLDQSGGRKTTHNDASRCEQQCGEALGLIQEMCTSVHSERQMQNRQGEALVCTPYPATRNNSNVPYISTHSNMYLHIVTYY